jgi:hypothetical protein
MAILRIKTMPGCDASIDTLQQMSDLRRMIMKMKPGIDLDRDFDKFCAACVASHRLYLFYTGDNQLVGMYLFALLRGRGPHGKRFLLIGPEYVMFLPEYRGTSAFGRSVLSMVWHTFLSWRGEQVWLGSIGYPAAMLAAESFFGGMVFDGEPGLTGMQQTLLDLIRREATTLNANPNEVVVELPTLPPAIVGKAQAAAEKNPLYQRYIALCPQWRTGFVLSGVVRVRPGALLIRTLTQYFRRKFRR